MVLLSGRVRAVLVKISRRSGAYNKSTTKQKQKKHAPKKIVLKPSMGVNGLSR
jgi:hypothetical protein